MPSIEDIWSQLDHKLATDSLRLKEIRLEKQVEKALHIVIQKRKQEGFVGPSSYEIFRIARRYLESYAGAICEVYEETWNHQGGKVTPEFLRAISLNAIDCAITEQVEKWLPGLDNLISRFRMGASLADASEYLRGEGCRIQDDYRSLLEVRATKMEYTIERSLAQPVAKSRRGRKPGQRLDRTKNRERVIQEVCTEIIGRNGVKPSTKQIVEGLAKRQDTSFPASWPVKSWGQVLSNKKMLRRAAKLFAKIENKGDIRPAAANSPKATPAIPADSIT